MGIVKKARIDDYWSTNPLIETHQYFAKRFRRLFKVQFIIDYFSKKFKENFNLSQNISIDEGMIPWRGRLNFKVYNPSKITKYSFGCCIYSGVGQPLAQTVMELLTTSYGKWHHLYMDNYYNSVELAENLLEKKIQVCGTIRQNRGFPEKLKRANVNYSHRYGELRKLKRMISTIHNATLTNTQRTCRKTNYTIKKPESVLDYNKYMKGVDRADQYLSYYPIYRKTIKWSKKVCMYLFNCALFNAFRTYQYFNTEHKSLRFHDFLLKVCDSRIKDHVPTSEQNLEVATTSRTSHHDPVDRLSGHQTPTKTAMYVPKTKKEVLTNLMCKSCGVALHLGDCFAAYHMKEKY
ncbi:hypothetical protein ACFW04_013838 [Cataglyphis niger]